MLQATSEEKVAERGDAEPKEKHTDTKQTAEEEGSGKLPSGLDFDIKTAMDLFGLEHVKVIREPADDTKVLVGWSADTVVLAFRGTNSFTNAKRDAQVGLILGLPPPTPQIPTTRFCSFLVCFPGIFGDTSGSFAGPACLVFLPLPHKQHHRAKGSVMLPSCIGLTATAAALKKAA